MDTLFSNVTCVTMDDNMRVITDAFVGVKDGKIAYIGQTAPRRSPRRSSTAPAWCSCPV